MLFNFLNKFIKICQKMICLFFNHQGTLQCVKSSVSCSKCVVRLTKCNVYRKNRDLTTDLVKHVINHIYINMFLDEFTFWEFLIHCSSKQLLNLYLQIKYDVRETFQLHPHLLTDIKDDVMKQIKLFFAALNTSAATDCIFKLINFRKLNI